MNIKLSKIKLLNFRGIVALVQFFLVLPIALIAKIFIRDFWLVYEDRMEARDNGYWFFKYVRENYPQQKIAYAIDRNSVDFEKVNKLGKTIQTGSWKHWFWYLTAKKLISSQNDGKPNDLACYIVEVLIPIWRNKRYFLQHGITINDGKWLYYSKTKFCLFVCGAKAEQDFVQEKLGYPNSVVQYLGFTRFDQLHNFKVDKDLILVMPSWRGWIARGLKKDSDFPSTEYFIRWNEFLRSPELARILNKFDKNLLFFPHRNMQKYLHFFGSDCERIEIAGSEKYDIQEILKKSALMITDYSSVFFDFAYMKKPVLFYQFDEEEFRARQYQEGYFDYHNNPLGVWSGTIDDLLSLLEKRIQDGFPNNDHVTEFFELYDQNNCERNYRAIRNA